MSDATDTAPEPVSLTGLIDELTDPPAPEPVSLVPQTAGWVVLAVVLVLLAGWAVWRWLAHRRANAYRRAALAELQAAGEDAAAIAAILRRCALAAYPRARVAALTGAEWVGFLNDTGGAFGPEASAALLRAPYREDTDAAPELAQAAAHWVRRHRRDDPAPGSRARAVEAPA